MEGQNCGVMDWVRQGLRAAALLPLRALPAGPGAWTMLLVVAAATAIVTGASRLGIDGPATFDLHAWFIAWAPDAFLILGIWSILSSTRATTTHESPVAAWYLLITIAAIPVNLGSVAIGALESRGVLPEWWHESSWLGWAIFAALLLWFVFAVWRASSAVTRSTAVAIFMTLFASSLLFLSSWYLDTQEWQPAEYYETAEADGEEAYGSFELSQELFESQQALLVENLQAITPATNAARQLYGLVYAPYDEDVFLRESAMVQQVLEERFDAGSRVIRLVNNSATAGEIPWATPLNLERSVQTLAKTMNAERDVLMVYLTSHGGEDFTLSAWNWPLAVEELTAGRLRAVLDEAGIRHRVVAVSACYSGGWIAPLQDENTLVMTAADDDHTSYGCGSRSELTFFGRAVFDEQLRKTLSFEAAFRSAVPVIRQREIDAGKDDGFSNPQLFVGEHIRGVLDELAAR